MKLLFLFIAFFKEKVRKVLWVLKKCVPLHSLSLKKRGEAISIERSLNRFT